MSWLLDRLFNHQQQPTPRFAFLGTVNWMRALALLVMRGGFEHENLSDFYDLVQRRRPNEESDTIAFECLLMAMHNVSALQTFTDSEDNYGVVRSAIIAWYYATYYSSKAMIAAATGSDPQTHAKTGRIWQTDIVTHGLVVTPFGYNFGDLSPSSIEQHISRLRGGNPYSLNNTPENEQQANGAVMSYLKGTAEHEKCRIEERVKNSAAFRSQGFADFRKKAARQLRDNELSRGHVNFLVQAFRYRGKANYRDAIYLSYGDDNTRILETFVQDLASVSKAFVYMIAHYIPKRVVRGNWAEFVADVIMNARFRMPFEINEI